MNGGDWLGMRIEPFDQDGQLVISSRDMTTHTVSINDPGSRRRLLARTGRLDRLETDRRRLTALTYRTDCEVVDCTDNSTATQNDYCKSPTENGDFPDASPFGFYQVGRRARMRTSLVT